MKVRVHQNPERRDFCSKASNNVSPKCLGKNYAHVYFEIVSEVQSVRSHGVRKYFQDPPPEGCLSKVGLGLLLALSWIHISKVLSSRETTAPPQALDLRAHSCTCLHDLAAALLRRETMPTTSQKTEEITRLLDIWPQSFEIMCLAQTLYGPLPVTYAFDSHDSHPTLS